MSFRSRKYRVEIWLQSHDKLRLDRAQDAEVEGRKGVAFGTAIIGCD